MTMDEPSRDDALAALERRVRLDLETIEIPLRPWVPERRDADGVPLADVVIVGAGLSGLAIAFGLFRHGVSRVRVIDAAEPGREGPWVTSARMRTLRSPKTMTGPDLGVPSLTYRSWHEARHGHAHWLALDKIDRRDWMHYLIWFRKIVGIRVENSTRLVAIEPADGHLRLQVETAAGGETIPCRKVVLATGIDGAGGHHVPAGIAASLPRERWAHSGEVLDISAIEGKDVGVIGSAASSFDWAVAALEAGARQVTILARTASMPQTEILDWSNFPGFLNHFADLDDRQRYRFTRRMLSFKGPPTVEMFTRAMQAPNCRLVLGAGATATYMRGDKVCVETPKGAFEFDRLLLGTGYTMELDRRPELAGLLGLIATWRDRFIPPPGESDEDLLPYPYLGPGFQLTEKFPGTAPFLGNIHLFNNGAVPSMGPVCNGITGLKSGVPRLVASLTRDLFLEDADAHYLSLDTYDTVHFNPPGFSVR
jgi:cation diffusion facilitator CzcD-associated flavoprotein CzcO